MVRVPLPVGLGDHFRVDEALSVGLGQGRLRGPDLERPFWGVRSRSGTIENLSALAAAYSSRMSEHAFFSHATAALLHEIPLPLRLSRALPLDVSAASPHRRPDGNRVHGHRLEIAPEDVATRRGLRMTGLERTVCDLASLLDDEELLAALDNVRWRKRRTGHRANLRSLTECLERFHGRRGRARLERLLPLSSDRADSSPESAIRLRFHHAGLPAMLVNFDVLDRFGAVVAVVDLQAPQFRMAFDYEGDHHRTDKKQWRKDLARVPRLQDAGWHHTRISADDLADSTELIARTHRRLRERGWRG